MRFVLLIFFVFSLVGVNFSTWVYFPHFNNNSNYSFPFFHFDAKKITHIEIMLTGKVIANIVFFIQVWKVRQDDNLCRARKVEKIFSRWTKTKNEKTKLFITILWLFVRLSVVTEAQSLKQRKSEKRKKSWTWENEKDKMNEKLNPVGVFRIFIPSLFIL